MMGDDLEIKALANKHKGIKALRQAFGYETWMEKWIFVCDMSWRVPVYNVYEPDNTLATQTISPTEAIKVINEIAERWEDG